MRKAFHPLHRTLLLAGICAAGASIPAYAQDSSSHVTIDAGAGYASNPFLLAEDDGGSAFGRISVYGVHRRRSQRSDTRFSAFLENTAYSSHYGSKQIFDLSARSELQKSETLRLFGEARFSGDIAAQLRGRFVGLPETPVIPDVTLPPDTGGIDPDLVGLTQRQYRVHGQLGATANLNARSTLNVTLGGQHVFFSNELKGSDYTIFSASGAFERQVSERTTAGARLHLQRVDYVGIDSSAIMANPQLVIRSKLSERWDASAAAGVQFTRQSGLNERSWATFSLDGSLCRSGEEEDRVCARVSRYVQPAAAGTLATSNSAALDYSRRLSADAYLRASLALVRYSGGDTPISNGKATYASADGEYSRKLGRRIWLGANARARKYQHQGPDPDMDLAGTVFIRYRLGDENG